MPRRVVCAANVITTFCGKGVPDKVIASDMPNAGDIILAGFFVGSQNILPNAPSSSTGISAEVLNMHNSFIKWPIIRANIPNTANFIIGPRVFFRAEVPEGYHKIPKNIVVNINFALFGPQVRI